MSVATLRDYSSDLVETPTGRFAAARWNWFEVQLARLAFIGLLLLVWQFVPSIPSVPRHVHFLNRFFISSPTEVATTLWQLITGSGGRPLLWPYVTYTLRSTFFGVVIGLVAGSLLGLIASNDLRVRQVFTPFVYAGNAIPKIAIIPIVIVMLGPGANSSIAVASLSAFFLVFFNAFAGGRSVPAEMIQNARLLGARPLGVMMRIRLMYVGQWTFEAMPNAISHALLTVVTAEVLSGSNGVGRLIVLGLANLDSSLTFAVVIILSVLGIALVALVELTRGRVLHWAPGEK
jgi:NitT/TauT family transport system permease protein